MNNLQIQTGKALHNTLTVEQASEFIPLVELEYEYWKANKELSFIFEASFMICEKLGYWKYENENKEKKELFAKMFEIHQDKEMATIECRKFYLEKYFKTL